MKGVKFYFYLYTRPSFEFGFLLSWVWFAAFLVLLRMLHRHSYKSVIWLVQRSGRLLCRLFPLQMCPKWWRSGVASVVFKEILFQWCSDVQQMAILKVSGWRGNCFCHIHRAGWKTGSLRKEQDVIIHPVCEEEHLLEETCGLSCLHSKIIEKVLPWMEKDSKREKWKRGNHSKFHTDVLSE